MKKLVSILLALVMVLSMGAVAFADDTTAAADDTTAAAEETTAAAEETTAAADDAVSVGAIVDLFKQIFANIDLETIKGVYEETKVTIEGIAGVIAPLFGSENGTPSFSLAEIPAMLMNAFIDGIAGLFGTDRESIIDKLLEIPFVKEIMGWYGYKPAETTVPATEAPTEAPVETEVPDTGATAGIAAFAALSVAAAAAFVSKKKEA